MVRPKARDSCFGIAKLRSRWIYADVQRSEAFQGEDLELQPTEIRLDAVQWGKDPVRIQRSMYFLHLFAGFLLQQGVSSTDPSKWLFFTYHQWSTSSSHCLWIKVEWTSQFGSGSWSLFSSLFLDIGSSKQAIKQTFEMLQHLWGVADRCLILQAPWHCWFWRPMISRWIGCMGNFN